jgi:hypothetical protein
MKAAPTFIEEMPVVHARYYIVPLGASSVLSFRSAISILNEVGFNLERSNFNLGSHVDSGSS